MSKKKLKKSLSKSEMLKRVDKLQLANQLPMEIRGRRFTYRGLRRIVQCVSDHYQEGRTAISQSICRSLKWRQPNGWLKDRACRAVLRRLESLGLLRLPPAKVKKRKTPVVLKERSKLQLSSINEMPKVLSLELAKGNAAERVWNQLIEEHHYLGHRVQVGRCLKYLIYGDSKLIGGISFASPAWHVASRDLVLNALGITGADVRNKVINNSRFCIASTARVPHLASRVLALAARQIAMDWQLYYSIRPVIAETFVEPTRFSGTCYRAANWVEIGMTSGYAKVGSFHHNSQEPKKVFLYSLNKKYRESLGSFRSPAKRDDTQRQKLSK